MTYGKFSCDQIKAVIGQSLPTILWNSNPSGNGMAQVMAVSNAVAMAVAVVLVDD